MIQTLEDTLLRMKAMGQPIRGWREWFEWVIRGRWPRLTVMPDWSPRGQVFARINAGRWIVDCPVPGCNEATMAMRGMRFVCPNCLNATNEGHAYDVVFPDESAGHEIESVLASRPVPRTRNWRPGETIDFLRGENAAHGTGVQNGMD
jgi:hypothetical protein